MHRILFFVFVVYQSIHSIVIPSRYIAEMELKKYYDQSCCTPSDINEHVPLLRNMASECDTVVSIGMSNMASTWGILQGLTERKGECKLIGIDANPPSETLLNAARILAEINGIGFTFYQAHDLYADFDPVDMLFIDYIHTYVHLTYELEKFSFKVSKYIAIHDTSEPFGLANCQSYQGNYSEYPTHVNRNKKGLWPAVWDFLMNHPEWELEERHLNNHGFTILKRVDS